MRPRSAQKERKTIHFPKYLKRFVLLGILVAGILLGWRIVAQIRGSHLLGTALRKNIVFKTTPIAILSLTADEHDSNILVTLDDSVSTVVPYGYGYYRIGAVPRLGEIEQKPQLFSETVEDLFGIALDGWISTDEPLQLQINEDTQILEGLKRTFSPFFILSSRVTSNLNFLDRMLLAWQLWQLRASSTRVYATHRDQRIFQDTKLPDASVVKTVNEPALELFLEQKLEDTKIRKDALTIKIFNTTSTAGLGQKFSRVLTNIGGKVIGIGNRQKEMDNCILYTNSSNEDKKIISFIQEEFNCERVLTEENLEADVVIELGKKLADRWQL